MCFFDILVPILVPTNHRLLCVSRNSVGMLVKLELYPVMYTVHVFLKNTHTRRPPSKRGAPPKRGAQPPVPRCPVLRALTVVVIYQFVQKLWIILLGLNLSYAKFLLFDFIFLMFEVGFMVQSPTFWRFFMGAHPNAHGKARLMMFVMKCRFSPCNNMHAVF